MNRILIVGYGSIGQRHKINFERLGADVAVVSRRPIDGLNFFSDIGEALADFKPELILICTETSRHYKDFFDIQKYDYLGRVIIEKPIFDSSEISKSIIRKEDIYVAYNLRFYLPLQILKKELAQKNIVSSHIYAGQYLPNWRSSVDYRGTYSAHVDRGGGVTLDLSHELDYALWLFGRIKRSCGIKGKCSSLDIDSDDVSGFLLQFENCGLSTIQLNYLDHVKQRFIIVNTDTETYQLDFIKGDLFCNGRKLIGGVDVSQSYENMAKSIMENDFSIFTTYNEALDVLKLIEASRDFTKGATAAL